VARVTFSDCGFALIANFLKPERNFFKFEYPTLFENPVTIDATKIQHCLRHL